MRNWRLEVVSPAVRRARSLVAAYLISGGLAAQADDPVRVITSLSVDALAAIESHLDEVLPDESCRVERLDTLAVSGRYENGVGDIDVVCGVDTQLLVLAAARGDLAPRGRAGLRSFWIDEEQRFVTPWARGWLFVWREGVVAALDDLVLLAQPSLDGQLAIPSPRAAPSLWGSWLRQWTQRGEGEDRILAWLAAVDARAKAYMPSEGATLAALESGQSSVGVLPSRLAFLLRDRLEASGQRLQIGVATQGMVLQGMGLGVIQKSPRLARAERVFDALLDPALTETLRDQHGLVTPDLGGEPGSDRHRLGAFADGAFPYAPLQPEFATSILTRWENHVRGRGSSLERFELIFDVVLAVLFVIVAWWIFRKVGTEVPPAEPGATDGPGGENGGTA